VTSFIGNTLNQGYALGPINTNQNQTAPRAYYGGINTDVMISIVNGKFKRLEFFVYHDIKNKNLNIWARESLLKKQSSVDSGLEDDHTAGESSSVMFINKLKSVFPLCCGDRIFFHFDDHKKWQQMGIIDFQEVCSARGQLFKVALGLKKTGPPGAPSAQLEKMPKKVRLYFVIYADKNTNFNTL
jgi:hypothetical protein